MNFRTAIFLTAMTVLGIMWFQQRSRAMTETVNALVELGCKHQLIAKFDAALELQQKDKELLILSKPRGLEGERLIKREDLSRLGVVFGEASREAPTLSPAALDFAYDSDSRKQRVVDKVVSEMKQTCPDEIRETEAARVTLFKFFNTYVETLH